MTSVLTLSNVSYQYEGAKSAVLKGINASFEPGKVHTIIGKSGAGKSTLLSLISGLDVATGGEVLYGDADLKQLDRDNYRAQSIGVVFQGFNLLTNATAVQNVILSMSISKSPIKDKKGHAYSLLGRMGINQETAERKVLKLSGGEQQRIGIARALSHNPGVLIADEPTGNLDKETEADILHIFKNIAREEGKCVIIVTHSKKVTSIADAVYRITNGLMNVV